MSNFERVLSRPAFMRYELGPILHTMLPDLLSEAADIADSDQFHSSYGARFQIDDGVPCSNRTGLMSLADDLGVLAATAARQWSDKNERAGFALQERLIEQGFTYYAESPSLLKEGLQSGFIVPINLYAGICYMNQGGKVASEVAFSPDDFRDTITRQDVRGALKELAYTSNGVLGSWSTNSGACGEVLDCGGHRCVPGIQTDLLSIDEAGDTQLSDDMRAFISTEFTRNNRSAFAHGDRQVSGGCPVRHDRYKKITPFARYFIDSYLDTAQLKDSQNALAQCAEFAGNFAVHMAADPRFRGLYYVPN